MESNNSGDDQISTSTSRSSNDNCSESESSADYGNALCTWSDSTGSLHTIESNCSDTFEVFSYFDPYLNSPLYEYICNADMPKIVEAVESGRDLNLVDNRGWTALHFAAMKGCLDILKYLLDQPGIRINVYNHEGESPLTTSIKNFINENDDKLEIIKLFTTNQDLGSYNNSDHCLIELIQNNSINIKEKHAIAYILLEAKTDPNQVNKEGKSSLRLLLEQLSIQTIGDNYTFGVDLICMLLCYNALVTLYDYQNICPYMYARINCDDDIINILFDFLYEPNLNMQGKASILMQAIDKDCNKVFTLIERGADINADEQFLSMNTDTVAKHTCLSLACKLRNPQIYDYIFKHCDKSMLLQVQPTFIYKFVKDCNFSVKDYLHYFYELTDVRQVQEFLQFPYACSAVFGLLINKMKTFVLDDRIKLIYTIFMYNNTFLDARDFEVIFDEFGYNEELNALMQVCDGVLRSNMILCYDLTMIHLIFRPDLGSGKGLVSYPDFFQPGIKRSLLELSRNAVRNNLNTSPAPGYFINFKPFLELHKLCLPKIIIEIITLKRKLYDIPTNGTVLN